MQKNQKISHSFEKTKEKPAKIVTKLAKISKKPAKPVQFPQKTKQKPQQSPQKPEKNLEKLQKFREFNTKVKEKLRERVAQLSKERSEERKTAETRDFSAKLRWKAYNNEVLPRKLRAHAEIARLFQENSEFLEKLRKSASFQGFFAKYAKILRQLFEFVGKRVFVPLNSAAESRISLEALSIFAAEFNICPSVFEQRHVVLIYKSLISGKTAEESRKGLDFDDFQGFLLRVAVKGVRVFAKIAEKIKETALLPAEIKEIVERDAESLGKAAKIAKSEEIIKEIQGDQALLQRLQEIEEEYQEIERMNVAVFEGLLYYLGLPLDPEDREYLERRLKEIRVKRPEPNKRKKKGWFLRVFIRIAEVF